MSSFAAVSRLCKCLNLRLSGLAYSSISSYHCGHNYKQGISSAEYWSNGEAGSVERVRGSVGSMVSQFTRLPTVRLKQSAYPSIPPGHISTYPLLGLCLTSPSRLVSLFNVIAVYLPNDVGM
jgi:hypothetical protein